MSQPRIIKTDLGARIVQHGCVLSEVLDQPGPTHSIFDLLAGLIHLLSPGPRVAILGFAGGGLVAPLRALGGRHALTAIDRSRIGFDLFKRTSQGWRGDVDLVHLDAEAWLRDGTESWDMIVEDLSVSRSGDVFKPNISFSRLPDLIRARLKPGGRVLSNLLVDSGMTWLRAVQAVHYPVFTAHQVVLKDFENRLFIEGEELPSAAVISRRLKSLLCSIESEQSDRFHVRRLGTA